MLKKSIIRSPPYEPRIIKLQAVINLQDCDLMPINP